MIVSYGMFVDKRSNPKRLLPRNFSAHGVRKTAALKCCPWAFFSIATAALPQYQVSTQSSNAVVLCCGRRLHLKRATCYV